MRSKKILSLMLASAMVFSLTACGSQKAANNAVATQDAATTEAVATDDAAATTDTEAAGSEFQQLVFGETGKEIKTTIKWLSHRTDLVDS